MAHFPTGMYRFFRTLPSGDAEIIPFQIDEVNENGDFVLDQGGEITKNTGNGVFDQNDELAVMGNDFGEPRPPVKFTVKKPALIYEIRQSREVAPGKTEEGAIYAGIYFTDPPAVSPRKYVNFTREAGQILTSRYRYRFDPKNYLVVSGVEMRPSSGVKDVFIPLLDSSTFYLNADLKYFLTFAAYHRTVDSSLEAYKIGPVRSIVRVSFNYQFLKINFELGMYTEVSFFSNAVYLPAILFNPVDGKKTLNKGSGFYYGFALHDNPDKMQIETNMPSYAEPSRFDVFKTKPKVSDLYWLSAKSEDRMMYVEIKPSKEMQDMDAVPNFYSENVDGPTLQARAKPEPQALGKSPVNIGLFFDLTKFKEGEHLMSFKLFFENVNDPKFFDTFKTAGMWTTKSSRIIDAK